MPGGVGRVSEATLAASSTKDRAIGSAASANEIFYHLHAGRVYFDSSERFLYFVDSPGGQVVNILRSAVPGRQDTPTIEQLHLDAHCFFNAARRVRLTDRRLAESVLVALRLAGVTVTLAQ